MFKNLFCLYKEFDEKSMRKKYVKIFGIKFCYYTGYEMYDKTNKLYKQKAGKLEEIKKTQDNLVVKFNGQNNTVCLDENINKKNLLIVVIGNNNNIKIGAHKNIKDSRILIQGDNNSIEIEPSEYFIRDTNINCPSSDSKFILKKNTSIVGAEINVRTRNADVSIGEECMFANNITIMSGDGHLIKDKTTKEPLHTKGFCHIGNHVWIGKGAVICKNTTIPDGCIVGANSIVTKSFDEKDSILAGMPAKIVKRNIEWSREYDF